MYLTLLFGDVFIAYLGVASALPMQEQLMNVIEMKVKNLLKNITF